MDPSLHLGSSSHELSFIALCFFGGSQPIDFPSKMVPCGFSLSTCHFLGLGPSPEVHAIYCSHPIGLLYFIGSWTLDQGFLHWRIFAKLRPAKYVSTYMKYFSQKNDLSLQDFEEFVFSNHQLFMISSSR